jgi:molecular chaperone GrpE (heat shock protein)
MLAKLEIANKAFTDTLGVVEIPVNFLVSDREAVEESAPFKLLAKLQEGPSIIQSIVNTKLDFENIIVGTDSTKEIIEKITNALVETKKAIKETGPALQDLQAEFKNTENTMSTFFNKAFPKTKFDDVAKQFVSLTNSFDTAIGKIENL